MSSNVIVADGDLVVRRLRDDDGDYQLMGGWRNLPHVRRWWDPDLPPATLDSIKEEYRPDMLPGAASTACMIELGGVAVGFIQFYRWVFYASGADEVGIPFDDLSYGLDIFIGDPDQIDRGVGTTVVTLVSDYLLNELDASEVSLTTDVENHRAQRAYEKAGFKKIKQVLDTDTYKGERVTSWLMVKQGAGS